MTPTRHTIAKDECARVLRRSGFSEDTIDEILSKLPDPIDLDRDGAVYERYGIGREQLMERMGGSP